MPSGRYAPEQEIGVGMHGRSVDFETGMALSLAFRGGERARSIESLIMCLRIWDGGCVKAWRFGSFRSWVKVNPVASGI